MVKFEEFLNRVSSDEISISDIGGASIWGIADSMCRDCQGTNFLCIDDTEKPNFETIPKEVIHLLSFPQADVLATREEVQQRQLELDRALALGNLEHSKIRIYFEDNESKKVVETTVWAVTDQRVILKQGHSIPINRIYRSA